MRCPGWYGGLLLLAAAAAAAAGCGDEPVQTVPSAPERPPIVDAESGAPVDPPLPDAFRLGLEDREETAWRALSHPDRWMRRHGIERMRAFGASFDELLRHAAREARHGRDVGLLADLLADHPREVLPLLLYRMFRTSPHGRATAMAALGTRREGSEVAQGVIMHRLLASEFRIEREACIDALAALRDDVARGPDPLSRRSSPERARWIVKRIVPPDVALEDRRADPRADAFFEATSFEYDKYGADAMPWLTWRAAGADLTPNQCIALAVELHRHLPGHDLPAALLARAGDDGLMWVRTALAERRHLATALAAAPQMGERVDDLLPHLLVLLPEAAYRLPVLAALSQCDRSSWPAIQKALLADWERRRAAAELTQPYELEDPGMLLLRLLRPRGGIVPRIRAMLDDEDTCWLALDLLMWSHRSARPEASAAIRRFVERRSGDTTLTRHQRMALNRALPFLVRDEDWFMRERARILREDAPFARYLPPDPLDPR